MRLQLLGVLVLLLALGGCGSEDSGGAGGAGGGMGEGGSGEGGSGGIEEPDDGRPRVDALEPDSAPVGARITVHGRNFNAESASRNRLIFHPGNREAKGVEVDPEGTWFRVVVPQGAVSGPTRAGIDQGDGERVIEGPEFTVTDDLLPPQFNTLDPEVITLGQVPETLTARGWSLYLGQTEVHLDGEPLEIDEKASSSGALVAKIPPGTFTKVGRHEVTVFNPPPGGGLSDPKTLAIVEPINLVRAVAIGERRVELDFDRAPGREWTGHSARNAYQVGNRRSVAADRGDGNRIRVTFPDNVTFEPNKTYEIHLPKNFTSQEGGAAEVRSALFRGMHSDPLQVGEIELCAGEGFDGPAGFTVTSDSIYVTVPGWNQVQVYDRSGNLKGFFGASAGVNAFHARASCAELQPSEASGLQGPEGRAIVTGSGANQRIYVTSTGSNELIVYGPSGEAEVFELADDHELVSPVALGPSGASHVVLAHQGEGALWFVRTDNGTRTAYFGGESAMSFTTAGGGLPAWTAARSAGASYVVEPGMHRIHKLDSLRRLIGSLGKGGSEGFDGGIPNGLPGTGPGEFTNPSGLAEAPGGILFVVDQANGGRVQRIRNTGVPLRSMSLGYVPRGIDIDADDHLWIGDPEGARLVRYTLH